MTRVFTSPLSVLSVLGPNVLVLLTAQRLSIAIKQAYFTPVPYISQRFFVSLSLEIEFCFIFRVSISALYWNDITGGWAWHPGTCFCRRVNQQPHHSQQCTTSPLSVRPPARPPACLPACLGGCSVSNKPGRDNTTPGSVLTNGWITVHSALTNALPWQAFNRWARSTFGLLLRGACVQWQPVYAPTMLWK